jgi:hypothetical protein
VQLTNDARWVQWQAWYEKTKHDVMTLAHNRHVWLNLVALQQTNDVIEWNQVVNGWLGRCFATTQAVGMRRITEHKERRPTLGRLLHELAEHPEVASRDRYMAALPATAIHGREGWTTFAPDDGRDIDPGMPSADLQRLIAAETPVRKYVNESLAHAGVEKDGVPLSNPTFQEIATALDIAAELVKRYHMLFHPGTILWRITPDLPLGWLQVFDQAWRTAAFTPVDTERLA